MSKEALVEAYLAGRITRRIFIRRLVAAGVTVSAAATYARMLHPEPAQAAPRNADLYDFYDFYDNGRMTGQGVVHQGPKFAHFKFELQCDRLNSPNKLHVHWGNKHHPPTHDFELTAVTASACSNDPSVPTPPAGFDTLEGEGLGTVDGVRPVKATWKFTDHGSSGDTASVVLRDAVTNALVFSIAGVVANGGNIAFSS